MAKQFVGFFSFLLSLPLGWAIFELYKDNDAFDLSFLKEHESSKYSFYASFRDKYLYSCSRNYQERKLLPRIDLHNRHRSRF